MKYIVLTDSDKELLLKLHDMIYMDADFIGEHILTSYQNKSTVLQRLRVLEDAKYIKSFLVPVEGYSRPANIYTLAPFGVEMVEQLQGIVKWNRRWTTHVAPWYQHQLMLNRVVMAYTKQAEEIGLEVKEWVSETRATWQYTKDKPDVIKPDGVLVLGVQGTDDDNFALFIELERSIAKRQNTVQKILRYNDFLRRGQETLDQYDLHVGFEIPVADWRVLFIGGNAANTKKTVRDILSIQAKERIDVRIPVLVANREDIQENAFQSIYHYVFDNPEEQKEL